jgi:hypothetical protein
MTKDEIKAKAVEEAERLSQEFIDFRHGVRTLFLIQRHKEGGETNNSKLIKKITRNTVEWQEALEELLVEKYSSPLKLRIYACVNDRNFNKAIHKFKVEQLEADLYDQEQKENFYLDIRNRFIGCLMQPPQRASSLFLFDCDDVENPTDEHFNDIENFYAGIGDNHIKTYRTKNGNHVITKPFNYTKLKLPAKTELKKDGLLLLSY